MAQRRGNRLRIGIEVEHAPHALHHIAQRAAGAGAVRELCDLLLIAHGAYGGELEAAAR